MKHPAERRVIVLEAQLAAAEEERDRLLRMVQRILAIVAAKYL
jgi:hypothetical protein